MSKQSHSTKSKHCKKSCFCLKVPHVHNVTYSVEHLNVNPLATYKKCKKCCVIKRHPVTSTVVVTPLPVSSF